MTKSKSLSPTRDPPNLMTAFGREFEIPKDAECIRVMEDGRYAWFSYTPIMTMQPSNRYDWKCDGCKGMQWDYCEPWEVPAKPLCTHDGSVTADPGD